MNINVKVQEILNSPMYNYLITIHFPDRRLNQSDEIQLVIILLHELSHILTYKSINSKIKYPKFDDLISYILHPREISNWAFSIVLDNLLNNALKYNISKLIDLNFETINFYIDSKIEFKTFENWRNSFSGDLQVLFDLQYKVLLSKSKVDQDRFNSLVKLCKKYERRLKGIIEYVKS